MAGLMRRSVLTEAIFYRCASKCSAEGIQKHGSMSCKFIFWLGSPHDSERFAQGVLAMKGPVGISAHRGVCAQSGTGYLLGFRL